MARSSRRLRLDTDIKPVSEFRANAAELIERVKTTGRPLVLTQRGHSAAVVLDVVDYQQLVDDVELLRDVRTAVEQIEAGKGISNRSAKAELRTIAPRGLSARRRHRIEIRKFDFHLCALNAAAVERLAPGAPVEFPIDEVTGTLMPKDAEYSFIEPGVRASYFELVAVPAGTAAVYVYSRFDYGRGEYEEAECVVARPRDGE